MIENIDKSIHQIIKEKNDLINQTFYICFLKYMKSDTLCYGNVSFHDYYNMMEMKKISFNKKTKKILLLKKFCCDIANEIISYV